MSRRIREWLPPGAATGTRVRDALEGAVDAWSGKWFAGTRARLGPLEGRGAGAPRLAIGWIVHGGGVAVPADGPDALRTAALALGADLDSLILSEADRDIVVRLAATILADLAQALCATLGLKAGEATASADPLAEDAGILLQLTDARGRPLAQAAIALGVLVPFLRAGIPAGPRAPLARMGRAIEVVPARLHVRLGESRINLGELLRLGAGDVLILDRKVGRGAAVALAAAARPFAAAALQPGRDAARLVLCAETGDA